MKRIVAVMAVALATQAFAGPAASEPFAATTAVSSERGARAAVATEEGTTFWALGKTWNAGAIDILRRILSGAILLIK